MDAVLEATINWFNIIGITEVNIEKLKRQLSFIASWAVRDRIGIFEAVTGFGKTLVAIIAIHRLNEKYPDANTIIVVPTRKLFKDWTDHIEEYGLRNVSLYVVNTYTGDFVKSNKRYKCDLLVVDEVHRVLSNEGILFNKTIHCTDYNMLLGLTATLDIEEREILIRLGIPVIDTVSMSEARRFGYISEYVIYNLGITLSPLLREVYDRFNDIYNANWAKFQYFVEFEKNLDLIQACAVGNNTRARVGQDWNTGQAWREWYAKTMGWDGKKDHYWSPTNIAAYANQYAWAMKERKNFIYSSHDKIEAVKRIVERIQVPTITFAETIPFVDQLALELGPKARAYHSKIKSISVFERTKAYRNFKYAKAFRQRVNGEIEFDNDSGKYAIVYDKEKKISGAALKQKIINDFEDGVFNVLCTAKALNEGFNVEGIELAIICSATSKVRDTIQRNGRALRFKPNKTARIVNLYLKDTQDERWLKKRQKNETNIRWITSVEEIV